jgi:hypothetical protein
MSTSDRFLTVRQWTEQYPWPPLGGVRHLLFNAKSNGFDVVARRVGRRVPLSENAMQAFIEKNGGQNARG